MSLIVGQVLVGQDVAAAVTDTDKCTHNNSHASQKVAIVRSGEDYIIVTVCSTASYLATYLDLVRIAMKIVM